MKTTRFSKTQAIAILKQGDGGIRVKDLYREHGISEAISSIDQVAQAHTVRGLYP